MSRGLRLGLRRPLSASRDGNYSASGTYPEDVRFRPEAPNLSSPLIARHERAFFCRCRWNSLCAKHVLLRCSTRGRAMSAHPGRILLIAAVATLSISGTSPAADMTVYREERVLPHKTHHQPRRIENTYSNSAEMRCTENVVSYRSPYERHTEQVTLCHPPLNWQTGPSTATIWSP
ncbi:conserved hypothetical protein [Agrobacterium deltaense NCPPB 1641]|uniref:Uncharacterized protein n=2 Tax=Rhizobium/Agrobacterium group TaxID=227290 RepID=A0A1S7TYA3_9HYPH|nr:conserved hypothetical protein [Agrobacterium deltaense NCPPB 1641]